MNVDKLKAKIKKDYNTISSFCRVCEIDRYEIQKLFAASRRNMTKEREERLIELYELSEKNKNKKDPELISDEDRKIIKQYIQEYGGVMLFVSDNPEFNHFSIWQIISGIRKKRNKYFFDLLNRLKNN